MTKYILELKNTYEVELPDDYNAKEDHYQEVIEKLVDDFGRQNISVRNEFFESLHIKKPKQLLHITAKHQKTGKTVDLYYKSIKQAKYFNPYLIEFEEKGFVRN